MKCTQQSTSYDIILNNNFCSHLYSNMKIMAMTFNSIINISHEDQRICVTNSYSITLKHMLFKIITCDIIYKFIQ